MAVRLKALLDQRTTDEGKFATVSLFADAKSDISDDMKVFGLPKDYTIDWGSSVLTSNGEFGQLKSDGNWQW